MYSLDQELAFATQKVREQRAVIATLQSELAAAREETERARRATLMAWRELEYADQIVGGKVPLTAVERRQMQCDIAIETEARYAREIAHTGEEVGNE